MSDDTLNPEAIRADMEAGTPGPWRAGASTFYPGLDGPLTARVYTETPPNEIEVTGDPCGTDARRIARLPDLERGYLDMRARAEAAEAKVSAARLYAEDAMRRCEALEPVSAANVAMAVLAALTDGGRDDA